MTPKGGDLRQIAEEGGPEFVLPEYQLDLYIADYAKPIIVLWDGIVMGGGAGISINCRYRIATERTLFAMPEVKAGFFPDVGSSHFLAKMPGHIGRYLATTADRITHSDALYTGLATHYVLSSTLPDFVVCVFNVGKLTSPVKSAER